MRLDKFLKVSRIIKRRTLAKEVADAGRITVNDKTAKSSTVINIDDKITIKYGNKILTFKVIKLMDSTKKDDAKQMYEILEEKHMKES